MSEASKIYAEAMKVLNNAPRNGESVMYNITPAQLLFLKRALTLKNAKYDLGDIDATIDSLLDNRFETAAYAKKLLAEMNDDSGRLTQIQLTLETRPEMFLPAENIGRLSCIHCNGTGLVAGVLDDPCDTCAGEGYITKS